MNPHSNFPSGSSSSRQSPTPIGSGEKLGVPQPLECLHGVQIPPFLSKTYELVDDPGLDPIISWSSSGQSFVVWDPVEFSRVILPRSFKHNNFSSFVRQLNTYGFRKIDTDRWEFANESFLQGKKKLLKNIQRRKSPQSHHDGSSGRSSVEEVNVSVEGELERLRIEKGLMMQEVFELQQQQRGTIQHMEAVNEKLQAAEHKQKQMVSFLAKVFQNPEFLDRIRERKEQRNIASPRTVRKFIKQHLDDQIAPSLALDVNSFPTLDGNTSSMPPEVQDIASHELSCLQTEDPLFKGKTVLSLEPRTTPEYFVSSPEDLAKERDISELFSPGIESIVKQEDGWNLGFESSGMMSQYGNEIWDNLSNKKSSEFGVPDELSDVWSLGSPQVGGASGTENRPIDEYTFDELESLAGGFEDNSYRKMDP